MAKLIVIVGATGGQGGAVVNAFLKDPEYRVRGITRNVNSNKAKALATRGVEMVQADQKDEASLDVAFKGAHAIFAVTDYYDFFFEKGKDASIEIEFTYGVNMAKAAAKVLTLKTYVWSTLPDTAAITGGEAIVPHFTGKGRVDGFIKKELPELYAKSTFTIFTIFAINMHQYPIFRPIWLESAKKWVQFYPTHPETPYPCIGDHATNAGMFVRAIVNSPPEGGTYVRCNAEDLTLESFLALWGRASGISPEPGSTKVIQTTAADYITLWGHMGEEQCSQWVFFEWMKQKKAEGVIGDGIPGVTLIEGLSLLSEEEKGCLKSVEESLAELDWSEIIVRPK